MAGVDWPRLLKSLDVDAPVIGQVTEALAGATDTPISAAYNRVEAALKDGTPCRMRHRRDVRRGSP